MTHNMTRRLAASALALLCSIPLAGVAFPASAASEEQALKRAVSAYSSAFLGGRGADAYGMLSGRCQASIGRARFLAIVDAAYDLYGPLPIKSLRVDVDGNRARATYSYAVARLNQRNEPWLKVSGRWRNNEC